MCSGILRSVCFVTADLLKVSAWGREWKKIEVIEYVVSSHLLDGWKSLRNGKDNKVIETSQNRFLNKIWGCF